MPESPSSMTLVENGDELDQRLGVEQQEHLADVAGERAEW